MNSLNKVFAIIEVLKAEGELKLQEIADALGLHKSTAHRLVSELRAADYVARDTDTKKYRLGLKFLDMASTIIENLDVREGAKGCIEDLNTLTGETIHLAMLFGNQAIYIEKKESLHAIRMHSRIGGVAPLCCTGVGKAILAFQPPEILSRLLASLSFHKHTQNTIIDREQLRKEIDQIRERGYATDNEEHERDIGCIAAPIRNYTGRVIASVSITAILYRLEMKKLLEFKDVLLEKSREISKRLGYYKEGEDER